MHIFEIKLAGRISKKTRMPIAFATIHRTPGSDYITVTIHPTEGKDRVHQVDVDSPEDVWSMADCLHHHLEGSGGTNSDVHGYYRVLEQFMD